MSLMEKYSSLIDSIYEAVDAKSDFSNLMLNLNTALNASKGGFNIQNINTHAFKEVYMYGYSESELTDYKQYYASINPWLAMKTVNFIKPKVVVTERTLDSYYQEDRFYYKTEFFNDFAKRFDTGSILGVTLAYKNHEHLKFSVARPVDAGFFNNEEAELISSLSPHLLRAMEVKELLEVAHSQNRLLLNSLDNMGMGLMLLNSQGNVIEINHVANQIMNTHDGLTLQSKKITAQHADTSNLIDGAIQAHNNKQGTRICDWISIPRTSLKAPYRLLIIHNNKQSLSHWTESDAAMMAILIDPTQAQTTSREAIKEHFDLTEREADIAQLLLRGLPAKKIASETGLSYESARWYIKAILKKSDVRSQPEFIFKVLGELSFSMPL